MSSKHRKVPTQVAIWLCVVAVGFTVGCGGEDESDAVGKTSAKAAAAEKDKNQHRKRRQPLIATEYPDDLPSYPGAKLIIARNAKGGGGASYTLESDDSVATVATQMTSLLKNDDWFVQTTEKGESHYIFADKGSRNLSIQVMTKNGVTLLNFLEIDLPK